MKIVSVTAFYFVLRCSLAGVSDLSSVLLKRRCLPKRRIQTSRTTALGTNHFKANNPKVERG